MTFMWYSNDMFHYMFRAEFVTLVSLIVPSGNVAGCGVFVHSGKSQVYSSTFHRKTEVEIFPFDVNKQKSTSKF